MYWNHVLSTLLQSSPLILHKSCLPVHATHITSNVTLNYQLNQTTLKLEMGKNPHCSGLVLFGFCSIPISNRYVLEGITLAGVLDIVRFVEIHDIEQSVAVTSQCRPAGQQDEIQRTVLVLIGELDRCFAYTASRIVVASHVAVSKQEIPATHRAVSVSIFQRTWHLKKENRKPGRYSVFPANPSLLFIVFLQSSKNRDNVNRSLTRSDFRRYTRSY